MMGPVKFVGVEEEEHGQQLAVGGCTKADDRPLDDSAGIMLYGKKKTGPQWLLSSQFQRRAPTSYVLVLFMEPASTQHYH